MRMPATPYTTAAHESTRRSSSKTAAYDAQRYQRREKAKSSHDPLPSNAAAAIADASSGLEPGGGEAVLAGRGGGARSRPPLSRGQSAPLLQKVAAATTPGDGRPTPTTDRGASAAAESLEHSIPRFPHSPGATIAAEGQDEDEVHGVVGALRTFQPFNSPELSEPLPILNIAVIGAEGVGKSTFVQKALELPTLPPSQAAERKIPIDGSVYLVRLLELPIEEIEIDDDETINWPDTIEDKMMPPVDGALALYDVQDRRSVEELPDMLNAIAKASIPAVLVSCKCDTPLAEREVNPTIVEEGAKKAIRNIDTARISELSPESNKRGILMLLNTIVTSNTEGHSRSLSAHRRRTQSNAIRPVSPRLAGGHLRAASEYTGYKDQRHSRHDSSMAGQRSNDRLRVPREDGPMHGSFLFEESASEHSPDSTRSLGIGETGPAGSYTSLAENGATFDELVDRLLAQPTSKSDLKFTAIFLALFRNFAAPGRLLEAIVERFDALERNGCPQILKKQTQLRYVALIEQWVSRYPGDFAFPKTKRRLRVFAAKLGVGEMSIFAQAAREINIDLEAVREDDDTNWAYCDRDREASRDQSRSSMLSTASTLIDDPMFTFEQELSGSTINDDASVDGLPKAGNIMTARVEQAQRQSTQLQAVPRTVITKVLWRALLEQPDDLIAKELTRMDWIMFSSIRSRDLIRDVSMSKEQKATCKNLAHVNRMTEHFNVLAAWVVNYILLRDKPKHRALMMEKFMRIARKLREMNNYNALGAIIAGIKSTSVHRLAATRELIPPYIGKDWMKLEILMAPSRSHFAYRLAWENSSSERIPYLPLHRRDLSAAAEGNRTFLDNDGERINWKKFEIMGEVVISLQKAQDVPYSNLGGSKGSELIKELVLEGKLEREEDRLYERSVQCEPTANVGGAGSASTMLKGFFKR